MKVIDALINSFVYAAYVIGACICGAAVDILALKILNEFLVIDLFAQTLIRIVIYLIVPTAVVSIVAYKEGYKEARWHMGETALSCAFAAVGAFLLALLFRFDRFVAGGVKYISSIIAYGDKLYDSEQIANVGYRYAIPVFVRLFLLYSTAIVIFKRLGADKRKIDRAELTDTSSAQEE